MLHIIELSSISDEWLEQQVEEHDVNIWTIKISFNDLLSDPRWQKLMKKMNLAD